MHAAHNLGYLHVVPCDKRFLRQPLCFVLNVLCLADWQHMLTDCAFQLILLPSVGTVRLQHHTVAAGLAALEALQYSRHTFNDTSVRSAPQKRRYAGPTDLNAPRCVECAPFDTPSATGRHMSWKMRTNE